ncbi:heat shock protein Hsp15 [Gammaproteobacteria bacterium]
MTTEIPSVERVRLDKWLWAARFFKTRSLAVEAIEGGKVRVNDERAKPAKEVRLGMKITVRTHVERTVMVRRLSDVRRPAVEAVTLYEETAESVTQREREAELRRLAPQREIGEGRPTKRDRRRITRFIEKS